MKRWMSPRAVADHVHAAESAVKDRMALTALAGIEEPWLNVGTAAQPRYSFFDEERVDRWWKEINEWRVSVLEQPKSDGESPGRTVEWLDARGRVRPARLRRSSSSSSSTAKTSASDTSQLPLAKLSRSLRSRMA